jgi:hypothetical protein
VERPVAKKRARRLYVCGAVVLLGVVGLGLYLLVLLLTAGRSGFARETGLHCLLNTAERYRVYSGLQLPPSAEVIAEKYDDWAFLDPQYRLVFRLSDGDLQELLASRPPWAGSDWKPGTKTEPPFGKPTDTGNRNTYSVFGVHGTTVFQGFNVDRDAREVEFIYWSM